MRQVELLLTDFSSVVWLVVRFFFPSFDVLSSFFVLLSIVFPLYVFNDHFAKWQIKIKTNRKCLLCLYGIKMDSSVNAALNISLSFSSTKTTTTKIYHFFINYEWHITNTRHLISIFLFSSIQLHSSFLPAAWFTFLFLLPLWPLHFTPIFISESVFFFFIRLPILLLLLLLHFKPAHCWRKCSFMPPPLLPSSLLLFADRFFYCLLLPRSSCRQNWNETKWKSVYLKLWMKCNRKIVQTPKENHWNANEAKHITSNCCICCTGSTLNCGEWIKKNY